MFQNEILSGFYTFLYYFGLICFITFCLGLAVWIIYKFLRPYDLKRRNGKRSEEKYEFQNLKWLKYQYYDMGRSVQEIANDQGVSIMTITKWLDILEEVEEEEDNADSTKIEALSDQHKKSKKTRICPYCRILMKYFEANSSYQCPRCERKFQDIF